MSTHQLFVGRIPLDAHKSDLEEIFEKYGKLSRCDLKQGTKMAFGFVEYEDVRDAEDAMKNEDGRELKGSNICVEWARGSGERRGGGGGGRGGFRGRGGGRGRGYGGGGGRDYGRQYGNGYGRDNGYYRDSRRSDYHDDYRSGGDDYYRDDYYKRGRSRSPYRY